MACPEREQIESLLTGRLDDEQAGQVLAHLRACGECRREAALSTGIRLALEHGEAGPACLTDEELCLLRDDALPENDRRRALAHLAGCPNCLAGLINLDRALDEAEVKPVAPPTELIQRAVALGTRRDRQTESSWLQRLLAPAFLVRFGLAASAAAAVFLLTMLVTTPEPAPELPAVPPGQPTVADAPHAPRDVPAPDSTDAPAPRDDQQPVPSEQADTPPGSIQPDKPDSTVATAKSGPWLDQLTASERARLLKGLAPVQPAPKTPLAHAFDHQQAPPALETGFRLGKAVGTLALFSAHLDAGSGRELAGLARHLADNLPSAIPGDAGATRLATFARSLAGELDSGADTGPISRKVEVFEQALGELLADHGDVQLGYQIGRMSLQMEVAARTYDLGRRPPRRAWPSRRVLDNIRTRLEKIAQPEDTSRKSVLHDLETLGSATPPAGPSRARRILEALNQLEHHLGEVP